MYSYDYITPKRPRVIGGSDVVDKLPGLLQDRDLRRPLIVTSPSFSRCGAFAGLRDRLEGFDVGVFAEVEQHSPIAVVLRARDAARTLGTDCVVSVGGGSCVDTGKGVVWYLDERAGKAPIRHFAIPSTLSGAEFTNTIGINIEGKKRLHVHNRIVPDVVLLDPKIAAAMPRALIGTSLLNAMNHSLEGIMSIDRSPMTDAICLHSIRMMRSAANDLERFEGLWAAQNGAALAVMDTSMLSVGLAHALAHVIGGRCRTPHSLNHGLVAAPVMRFNLPVVAAQQRLIAEAFGFDTSSMNDTEAAWKAVCAVRDLVSQMGAPPGLRELGVAEADLRWLADHVREDKYALANPRSVSADEALEVLYWAWRGQVPPPD